MINLIWRTDVHISDRGPSSRTDDWTETVIHKLTQVASVAHKIKADGIIDGGDFFHEKSPKKISHDLIRKIVKVHEKYPCDVWCNVGNHDVVRGNIENLPQQPLEVLFSTGIFKRNYDNHEAIFTKKDLKVRVVGVPYHGTKYDMSRVLDIPRGDEDWLVVSCHLLASPAGGSMFGAEDIVSYKDLASGSADIYAFGHSHADQGITQITDTKWVINTGSLTRGSLHEDELKRKPKIVIMSFTGKNFKLTPVNLKIQPPEEVFDLDNRLREDTRAMLVDDFVDKIKKTIANSSVSTLEDYFLSFKISEDIKERALSYLEDT